MSSVHSNGWSEAGQVRPASGCIEFARGSHEDRFDDNNLLSRGQKIRIDVAADDKVPIEIHSGQIRPHHGRTIRGSGPNTTGDRRIACVIRYVDTDVAQEVGEKDDAMPVRSIDRPGHFTDFAPPRGNFTSESLALHDEIRSAQAKVMMKGTRNAKGLCA
ncbi:phytanoyl-CoA dioxygenase family protein [Marimonas arenosa]|uniref:Phytanoyl-CoA dioxygenase family protein n=1 Tax=Marimonas arenosa TaxID=1795305 RepID=A0AAE3WGM7_9RHOB|nr:phytanoyl-CoA dioxygenase family protein [Marimonas arenosa]MDQ2092352.1 phytanoyl-CoA dioxygenase family protein [Marimonas arenosa]